MGIKTVYKIEGIIHIRDSCLHFLNRFIPFFPKINVTSEALGTKVHKIDVPFIDEVLGLAMIKLLDLKTGSINIIKVKCIMDFGFLDVTNNASETLIFSEDEAIGIVDILFIGYY